MITLNEKDTVALIAAEYFGNGYHCAEAVTKAVLESMDEESGLAVSHATAFGGGFGESFCEACGVITGSLIVIGHLHGKRNQGDTWKKAARIGDLVAERFKSLYGTTNCGQLRDRFGEEEQMELCRELVRQGARNLLTLLKEESEIEDNKSCDKNKCNAC